MEVILVCIGTIITSYIFDTSLGFQMFKDVADEGYKINTERYNEFVKSNSKENDMNKLMLFPFVNIGFCFWKLAKYNEARPYLIDQLRVIDAIEPFTKEEENKYKAKPTGLNAMIISIIANINTSKKEIEYVYTDENGNKAMKKFASAKELNEYLIHSKEHSNINKEESAKDSESEKTSVNIEESDKLKELSAKKQALKEERESIINSNNQSPVEKTLKKGTKNLKNQ